MIRVYIDTNYNYLGPNKPVLTKKELTEYSLFENQRVIAWQDDDEWIGIVRYDSSLPKQYQWYIELEV